MECSLAACGRVDDAVSSELASRLHCIASGLIALELWHGHDRREMIEILVVEDNPGDACLVNEFLSGRYVVRVTIAQNGEEALLLLMRREYRPDLIVIDLKTAMWDGHEVLRHMRRRSAMKVPIVVLSSSSDPDDIDQAYASGANAYCEKPPDPDGLVRTLQSVARLWVEPLCRPYA